MSKFGEIKLADGRTVNLIQQAYNDNNAQGLAAWFACGYLSDENPDDETGPTVRVEWASKGADEPQDDADWDSPVSAKHYHLGELIAAGNPASLAEQASAALGDDGSRWATEDGEAFVDVMRRFGADTERSEDGRYRYEFTDGSAIVESGGAWDIEGDEPFSWRG